MSIKKFIKNIKSKKEIQTEDYYISPKETNDILFIWGVLSCDNFIGDEANLYTLNDLDLVYHKDTKNYSLGVETIYMFDNNSARYGYMQDLLNQFTKFMEENNHDTNREFDLYKVFTEGISINTKFNTIAEAYAAFKMMVNGYCSMKQ